MSGRQYVKSAAAVRALGISRKTLIQWAATGGIYSIRHGNGHRLYDLGSVAGSIGSERVDGAAAAAAGAERGECERGRERGRVRARVPIDVCYARVSTRKQLDDLKSQGERLQQRHPGARLITDCGSGLNFKRKGLQKVLELATQGALRHVYVAHRDRLCRFAFDLVEFILHQHGAQIFVDEHDADASPESELVEDVLAVVTVFGARLYGKRSAGSRKRRRAAEASEGGATGSGSTSGAGADGRASSGAEAEGGAVQAPEGLAWAAADLQGARAADGDPAPAVEALLRGGAVGVQLDGGGD